MTRNEAANLDACLDSLGEPARFARVVVVDSGSTDGTPEIARRRGVEVVAFQWNQAYPKKKQWCLDRVAPEWDWVLFLDADERLCPALIDEIDALFRPQPPCAGYFVDGRTVFLGRRLRFGHRNRKLALVDRRRARFLPQSDLDVATMWEVEGHYQPVLDGPAGGLRGWMWHEDRKPLYSWFERHNRYSDWEAMLAADGRLAVLAAQERGRRRWLKRLFQSLPARPLVIFLYDYVVRLGCLDGIAGLHFALARAFYYWQIGVKRAALVRSQRNPGP